MKLKIFRNVKEVKKLLERDRCCSVLVNHNLTLDKDFYDYKDKWWKYYGGYNNCVIIVGWLLEGTNLHDEYLDRAVNDDLPCSGVREYLIKAIGILQRGTMDTE